MPEGTLELARDSLRRMRQIDYDLELMRHRIGGQGTGMGTHIDHTTVLDVMRNVDEYMDAVDGEMIVEREWCARDVDAGWLVVFGVESMLRDEGMDDDRLEGVVFAVALRYLYGVPWDEMPGMTAGVSTAEVVGAVCRWMNARGLARIKATARGE